MWIVIFSKNATKQYQKLKLSGSIKPSIIDTVDFLAMDLKQNGPYLSLWPHYKPLGKDIFHCHLKKGHPTYVACWRIVDKKVKVIEIYYVGTHEKAPY